MYPMPAKDPHILRGQKADGPPPEVGGVPSSTQPAHCTQNAAMKFSSSPWRNHTRTTRLLTCAAVASLLMTGCASDQTNTSRQADGVPAVLGSEQPSASPTATPTSDEDTNTDSNETTDENSQANQASPEATPSESDSGLLHV